MPNRCHPCRKARADSSASGRALRGANLAIPAFRSSEGIPGRLVGVFQIANIGAEPRADAGANRRELQLLVRLKVDSHAADQISRALDAGEMVEDLRRRIDVVDQDQSPRAIAADVKSQRRSLPIDLLLGAVLQIKRALAIAQSADKGCGRLLTDDVAARPAGLLEDIFNGLGHALGGVAEEGVAGRTISSIE